MEEDLYKLLKDAERLVKKGNIDRAIIVYESYFFNNGRPNISNLKNTDVSCLVINSFIKNVLKEGSDMVKRLMDAMNFFDMDTQESIIQMLKSLTRNSNIDGYERINAAVSLYNNNHFNHCNECFSDIACDENCDVKYRVEACKFLFASDIDTFREIAQECLIEIIEDKRIPNKKRYDIICEYASNRGISSVMNSRKLNIPFDETFVFGLQVAFFKDPTNDIRCRLLSGQHLLQMKLTDDEMRTSIISEFLAIADGTTIIYPPNDNSNESNNSNDFNDDPLYEENTRADAADMVLRLGSPSEVDLARKALDKLGYAAISTGKTFSERIKTIYSTTQNIHDEKISETVINFVEEIIKKNNNPLPYQTVFNNVTSLFKKFGISPKERITAIKALNRVSNDTATFTSYRVTIAEVLVYIWMEIETFTDEQELLQKRLIEELIEMSDTCSSGHIGRFVNVLSGINSKITISFESQIKANVAGRLDARIRNLDEETRESVSMGMLPEADEHDKNIYKNFIIKSFKELEEELRDEFVPKYITCQEFENHFLMATESLKNNF